jgi:hypothetical protein
LDAFSARVPPARPPDSRICNAGSIGLRSRAAACILGMGMFESIRSLLGAGPKRSEIDVKLDEALANARSLDHYFFFPDQSDAQHAAERLQERGWTIESMSLNRDLQKWLLQARQPGPIENLQDLQTDLDLFADELHGEYDGWQVPGVTEHL